MLIFMNKYFYFLAFLFSLSTLAKSQQIIKDSIFTTTLDLYGSAWDNALIKNCTFKNTILCDGLRIAGADNVIIDSCVFYNIQGNGIRLHPAGISDGVIIKNCSFDSIYGNGIVSDEQHTNTQILNNSFNWIGLDTLSTLQGAPHHGIYFTGNDFLISGNRIRNIYNNNGNGISVRTNGTVRNNIVSDATKNGISYYSDHPNFGSTLLVENNINYNCERGISIANGGKPYVDSTIVRFNTFITNNLMSISIGSGLSMKVEIYGNILIRTDGSSIYIWAESTYNATKNVTSSNDIGFVDFLNHNYHITNQSIAYSFATNLPAYPPTDFENDPRNSIRLDAGAHQINTNTGLLPNKFMDILVFPNPSENEVTIALPSVVNTLIEISDLQGKRLIKQQNKNTVNIANLPKGIYIITVKHGLITYCTKFLKQ